MRDTPASSNVVYSPSIRIEVVRLESQESVVAATGKRGPVRAVEALLERRSDVRRRGFRKKISYHGVLIYGELRALGRSSNDEAQVQ